MAIHDITPIQLPLAIEDATVEIQLTRGYTAVVDAIDADLLELKWTAMIGEGHRQYAYRKDYTGGVQTQVYMHRVILQRVLGISLARSQKCDHKDGNGLNNRRSNLRLSTNTQNSQNARRHSNSTSPYKGITFDKSRNRWKAQIAVNGINRFISYAETAEAAYAIYCEAAREHFGEFARLE